MTAKKSTRKKSTAAKGRARRDASSGKGSGTGTAVELDRNEFLAVQILEELDFSHGIEITTLDIAVREGGVVARGVVADQEEYEALQTTVVEAGGDGGFENLVQIASTRREEDRDRARAVQDVMDAESDLGSENIIVACLGRKVVLRGSVSDPRAKVKAGLLALRQPEVSRLRNRLVLRSEV